MACFRFTSLSAVLCSLAVSLNVIAEDLNPTEGRLLQDLKVLAGDELEGRGIGTAGLDRAAEYVANAFRNAGLNVTAVAGGPFQKFEVVNSSQLEGENRLAFVAPDGIVRDVTFDKDCRTASFGGSGAFMGEIVFLGYGISSGKEPVYDDYAGQEVKGKTILIMRRTPQQADEQGLFSAPHGGSLHAALKTKISTAYSQGAAAVLFVNDPYTGKSERKKLEEQRQKAQSVVTAAERDAVSGAEAALRERDDARRHLKNLELLIANDDPDLLVAFGFGGNKSGAAHWKLQAHRPISAGLGRRYSHQGIPPFYICCRSCGRKPMFVVITPPARRRGDT